MRSVPSPNLECSGSPIEQLNQITHWLDNSNVYGSLPEVAKSVRSNQDGLLKVKIVDGQEQLPIDTASNGNCLGDTRDCALAGNLLSNVCIHVYEHIFQRGCLQVQELMIDLELKYGCGWVNVQTDIHCFKVKLEFSFSFPGFSFPGLDLVFKSGFQT